MAILEITLGTTGLAGVEPRVIYIKTNDTLATVTTAGYLNHARQQGFAFQDSDMACVSTKTTPNSPITEVAWLEVSLAGGNASLVPTGSPGNVVLPTVANALVHATNATGTLSTAAATVFNQGSISAGLSGTAGSLFSFPATPVNGFLEIRAVANGGARNTIIVNAVLGQTTTFTIPDPGIAATNFLLTNSAGTQTIATGSLALTLGNLTVAAGNIAATLGSLSAGTTVTAGTGITSTTGNITATAGNVIAGSAGTAGTFISFPATAGNGTLILAALNAGGAFNTTIRNSATLQSTVYSIPDAGAATANFIISSLVGAGTQAITTGSLQVSAGNVIAGAVTPAAGSLISYPAATGGANDRLVISALTTGGNFGVTLSNTAFGQSSTISITDPANATGFIPTSTVSSSLTPVGLYITKTVTLGFAALAAGGTVAIQTGAGAQQYKVRDIKVNYGAAGLSGGGGDRLIQVTDGTTVYNNAGITAALLGTPVNTAWGGAGNPLPGTVSADTSTVAGQTIRAVYAGGATDYTAGSVDITVALERVA